MRLIAVTVLAAAFLWMNWAASLQVLPSEMNEKELWIAAKFDGQIQSQIEGAMIEVQANHGPVQSNIRGSRPLRIGVMEYESGLYCHAPSRIVVHLSKPCKTFEVLVGIDTNEDTSGGSGSVVFAVSTGNQQKWNSGVMREGMPALPVLLDMGGAMEFVLEVSNAGDGIACDQADWVNAKATLEDGTVVWLGELPLTGIQQKAYTAEPFFSFSYDGKPSNELLPLWKMERSLHPIDDVRIEHSVLYTDPESGLQVRCTGVEYLDFPTVEWTVYFKNTSNQNTPLLSDIHALDMRIERSDAGEFLLHSHTGDLCIPESYEPHTELLNPNTCKFIANSGGRPTQTSFPYFNIEWPGEGMICVVSWAGQWNTKFTRDAGKKLRLQAGQEGTNFTLYPGEEVRGPMIVLQFYKGEWLRAQNIWRRWMLAHNTPRPGGKPLQPQASLCTGNFYPQLMTEATQERAFLERHIAEGIAFNCWWQDAGWYPCDGVGWPKTGTWEVDPVRFPKGIRELSDLMHEHDKKVMVWFEPERVHKDTWITENHPEWVYGGENGGLLRLGEPDCRAWLTDHIEGILTSQGIDYYRQDFNMDPLSLWRANDAPDRQGITEIRHIEGYFAYWDELLRRHPDMLIDSCASGGRRNDLETLRRAVPLLRSDWYNSPAGQQCLTYGLSLWMPYHGTGVIYEKDEYWIRSSMVAEMSYGPGPEGVDKFDFKRLKRLVEEHLRIAPYFLGDFYPLTPYTLAEDQWMAWQFDRPDLGEGVVQVFRRQDSPYESARFKLHELEPTAQYTITNLDDFTTYTITGNELVNPGILVSGSDPASCKVFLYKIRVSE